MPTPCTCWGRWPARSASDVAIELIGRAIALNPAVADYHSNLGESYRRAGRWDVAIACLRRAIELKPDHAEAQANLGNALMDAGRSEEAIHAFRQAIAMQPKLTEVALQPGYRPEGHREA